MLLCPPKAPAYRVPIPSSFAQRRVKRSVLTHQVCAYTDALMLSVAPLGYYPVQDSLLRSVCSNLQARQLLPNLLRQGCPPSSFQAVDFRGLLRVLCLAALDILYHDFKTGRVVLGNPGATAGQPPLDPLSTPAPINYTFLGPYTSPADLSNKNVTWYLSTLLSAQYYSMLLAFGPLVVQPNNFPGCIQGWVLHGNVCRLVTLPVLLVRARRNARQ